MCVVPLPAILWSGVVLPQFEALPFLVRAKRSSELRQPFGLKYFKLRQKQFKPEARIRQFCYAKLPGGRDGPREGVRVKQGIVLNTNTLCIKGLINRARPRARSVF